jgi:hypothetical protein
LAIHQAYHPTLHGSVNSGQLVEKEIEAGNPAVTNDDEISPGVSRRLAWAA